MSKPVPSSAALPIVYVVLRILILMNWMMVPAILALLFVMPNERWIMSSFDLSPSPEAERLVMGLRAIAVLGLAAIPPNHLILTRLLAIVETVRAGDPFVAANASRLQAIAGVLLTLQLLSLVIGAIAKAVSTPTHPLHLDSGASAQPRCWFFDQWLARRVPHVPAGPRVRGGRTYARRPRRDGVTWRSRSSSTTCSTNDG